LLYYSNNLIGTLNLMNCMAKHGCFSLVFSSSATVYGEPDRVPILETARLSVTNAYGRTKLHVEEIMRDTAKGTEKRWRFVILRYFNPIGAHPSGLIGEYPAGIPNNLAPYILQVVAGRRPFLCIFGDDYNTVDGTGVRDYIHVVDLARGHLAALHSPGGVFSVADGSCESFNLGTGFGLSVKQLLAYFSKASGKELPFKVAPRRPGDVATCYADPTKALKVLQWKCSHSIEQAVADGIRWQTNNPHGSRLATAPDPHYIGK
jgi:UDP-glucose 4-epimerase